MYLFSSVETNAKQRGPKRLRKRRKTSSTLAITPPLSFSLSLFPLDLGMRPIYLSFFLSWSRGKGKGKKLKPLRTVGLALFRERKKRKERKKWEIGKMEKYSSTSHNLAPGLAVLGLLFALSFSFYLLRKHEKSRKKEEGRRKKNRWAYCPRDSKWNLKRRTRSAAQRSVHLLLLSPWEGRR